MKGRLMLSRGKVFVKLLSAIVFKTGNTPNEFVAIGERIGKQNVLPAVSYNTQDITKEREAQKRTDHFVPRIENTVQKFGELKSRETQLLSTTTTER